MSFVIGIDGGGSGTVCLLMDEAGAVSGRGVSGPANIQKVSRDTAFDSIKTAIVRAVASEGHVEVRAVCLGLAGVGRPLDVEVVYDLIHRLKSDETLPVKWLLQPSTTLICSDCLIALVGGTGKLEGVVVITGTGSIAYGRNRLGEEKRVGGWGHTLGDEGSAYDIAIRGIKAALMAHDGRSGPTNLEKLLVTFFELDRIEDIVELVYVGGLNPHEIAGFAPVVDQAAVDGDAAAVAVVKSAAMELVQAVQVVIESVFNRQSVFDLVTAGGVLNGSTLIRDKFMKHFLGNYPSANVILPLHEPAYGACLMALSSLGKYNLNVTVIK